MKVGDLNRDQLTELKQHIVTERNYAKGWGASYQELADADSLVSDDEVFEEYGGTEFSEDDFLS